MNDAPGDNRFWHLLRPPKPGPHPTGGSALYDMLMSERGRIEGLSRIRELVLGFQDGLLVPLAVVTGLAGASSSTATILVGGICEAGAGALAMGTGAFLASQAENQLFRSEIADEASEFHHHREVELLELEMLLQEEGVSPDQAKIATRAIATSEHAFVRTMVEKELGIPYGDHATATGDAFIVGIAFAIAALIPLWPYVFFGDISFAMTISLVVTAIALFGLGVAKGRIARMSLFTSGIQVLIVGAASATVGFTVGDLVPRMF